MAIAVQQSNVQLQKTLATILEAEKNDLVEQDQNATSTTTHRDSPELSTQKVIDSQGKFDEEPMERSDRLFKLRSYLGADDRRFVDTENQQHNAQHEDVLHTRDDEDTVQVLQCRCERGVRRMEAVREGMGAKVGWTPEERVVLPTQRRHTETGTSG